MLIEEGEAADAVRRRLPPIDMEPDGTKPNSKKDPQPGFTIRPLRGSCLMMRGTK